MKWPYWKSHEILGQFVEELGEVARILNQTRGQKKPPKKGEPDPDLELEMGDLYFSLICMANSHGIDLNQAFDRAFTKIKTRDKERF